MELSCDMCDQVVEYGEDYVSHLQIVHGITKNFGFFLNKSLQNIKGAGKRKADAECITLEEDEDDVEEEPSVPAVVNNVLDEDLKKKLEDAVHNTFEKLFQPINDLIDGKVPLDSISDSLQGDISEDPFSADESIMMSFQKLKDTITNIEIPRTLIDSLVTGRIEKDKDESVEFPSKSQFKSPNKKQSVSKPGQTTDERKSKPGPTAVTSRRVTSNQNSPARPPPPQSPARSDNSNSGTSSTSASGTPGRVTTYWCPLEGCKFSTSKEGLTGREASEHLKKSHAMTKEKMAQAKAKGQNFKFKKVKSEK